jgi:hypothetical protein
MTTAPSTALAKPPTLGFGLRLEAARRAATADWNRVEHAEEE